MNKILERKYFSLALAMVIAVVVFFVAKATEDVPIVNIAAFAFFVALCCAGAWAVATFFMVTKQDAEKRQGHRYLRGTWQSAWNYHRTTPRLPLRRGVQISFVVFSC